MTDKHSLPPEDLEVREAEMEKHYDASKPLTEEEAAIFYFTHVPIDLPNLFFPETGRAKRKKKPAE